MNIEKGFFLNLLLLSENFFSCGMYLYTFSIVKCRCTFKKKKKRMSVIWAFIVLWELITIDLCKMLQSKGKSSLPEYGGKNSLAGREIERKNEIVGMKSFIVMERKEKNVYSFRTEVYTS